jgi:diacylglycerol kinase (ATP)
MIGRVPGAAKGDTVALVVSPNATTDQPDVPPHELLQRAGLTVAEQLDVAEAAGDIRAGKRWRRNGHRAVVAAGGDGTIGTTAGRLLGTGIPLGILPMGTSNDVARALGIPFDLSAAAAAIVAGVPVPMDVGVVEPLPGDGERETSLRRWLRVPEALRPRGSADTLCFLHAATLGLNVAFARLATDASRRAALGSLNYPAASLEALTHLQVIPVKLRLSGVPGRERARGDSRSDGPESRWQVTVSTEVLQLAVINTPVFGGALNLSLPGVDAHDELLDVFLVEPPTLEKGLETVRALMERLRAPWRWLKTPVPRRRGHESRERQTVNISGEMVFPGIRRYQAREVSIETASPLEVTLDGELRARTPVRIRVAPAHVAVLLRPSWPTVVAGRADAVRK